MLFLNILKANRWSCYPSPMGWDCIGALFTLFGFILALLSLNSNTLELQTVYFMKLTENPPTDLSITFGLHHYCIHAFIINEKEGAKTTECFYDKSIMAIPFDERITELLNGTHPQLFQKVSGPDPDTDTEGKMPRPPHNPHMYSALILLLIFAGTSLLLNLYKISQQRHLRGYRDVYFSRGFMVLMSCVFALLLVILSACMYDEAIYQLNTTYPRLEATTGPCVPMIGCTFLSLFLASAVLLMGCGARIEDSHKYFVGQYSQVV